MNLVYRIASTECLRDNEDTAIGRLMQSLIDILDHQLLILHETVHTLPDHTQALLAVSYTHLEQADTLSEYSSGFLSIPKLIPIGPGMKYVYE